MDTERFWPKEKLISWFDIAKGLGKIALEFVTKQIVHEPQPFESDHYKGPDATPRDPS